MTKPDGFHFELSDHEGYGRLSVGPFPEFSDSLRPEHTRLLVNWWHAVARASRANVTIWCATRQTPFAPTPAAPKSLGAADLLKWTQDGLLRATEHLLRPVSATFFTPGSVIELWSADGFAILVGAPVGRSEIPALERLLQNVLPLPSLLQHVEVLIVPWYHRQWLDLYCSSPHVRTHVTCLVEAAAQVGIEVIQGRDEFV